MWSSSVWLAWDEQNHHGGRRIGDHARRPRDVIEASVLETVEQLNGVVEKHARMGGVILTYEPWSIENGVLTPTLKIKRDQISDRFGEEASAMAVESAESKT